MPTTAAFRPDGWGERARIGLITPHNDIVPETEFHALAGDGVSVHVARVPLGWRSGAQPALIGLEAVRAFSEPPDVDNAVEMLAAMPLGAIAYGFTSSGYLLGLAGEERLKRRLERRAGGIPVAMPCQAAVMALRALGADKLAVVNPPWFPSELSERGADYFRETGMDVVYAASAEALPHDPLSARPESLYGWVLRHVPGTAETLFLGGGGWRAIGVVEALERTLALPVLTANQVVFWQALRLAGVEEDVEGYGRIFAHPLPA